MTKRFYMVMDGRAIFDTDRASVIDTIGRMSYSKAVRSIQRDWGDYDAVLVSYKEQGENKLVDERVEGHVNDL